jgi:hypothetical protein
MNACEASTLPRWHARNASERQAMIDWVIAELVWRDAQLSDYFSQAPQSAYRMSRQAFARSQYRSAIDSARYGDLEPLRKLFPEHAEFIHEPPRTRGQHKPKRLTGTAWIKQYVADTEADLAVRVVKEIREIWREHYKGQFKRQRYHNDVSAEDIAGVYLDMTYDEVVAAMKAHSR